MPGGIWAAQFGLPNELLTPRSMGKKLDLGDLGDLSQYATSKLPPLPGEEEKKERILIDRTAPCPQDWVDKPDKSTGPKNPPGSRPPRPVVLRTRRVTKAPRDVREREIFIPSTGDKEEGTISNPYDPPRK